MEINKEIKLIKDEDFLIFDTLEEFKNWANSIYQKNKDKKNVRIEIIPNIYNDYGDIYSNIDVVLKFTENETEGEKNKRLEEEELANDLSIIPDFMAKHNIANFCGTAYFLKELKKGTFKVSYEDFLEFKKEEIK